MMDRVYFNPGDIVALKKSVHNSPTNMIVSSVDKTKMRVDSGTNRLLGVTCVWFTDTGFLQSHRFDTKDLKHIKDV